MGFKFKNIYSLFEISTETTGEKEEKAAPILGCVSMLTSLLLIRKQLPHVTKDSIVIGDRDHHIRVSNYPKGYIIDKFLFGNST